MARKKRFHSQIPVFNPADRYTFFDDLLVPTTHYNIDLQKRALYRHAHGFYNGLFHTIAQESQNASEIISSAIEFLGAAAENERRKEIHAIEYYLTNLQNRLPANLRKGRQLQTIINDLKDVSKKLAAGRMSQVDIDNFYVELTTYINMVKKDIEDFRARVHEIANDTKDDRGMRAELAAIRLKGDFETLFKSISGQQAKNTAKSFSSRVRNISTDFLIKKMKVDNIDLKGHFSAVLAGIIADFEHYVQHERNMKGEFGRALDDISKAQLEDLFLQYTNSCNTLYMQKFSKYAQGTNVEEFISSLERFEKALGLELLPENSKAAKDQLAKIQEQERLMAKVNKNGRNYVARALKDSGFSNIAESTQLLTWSFSTQTGHGTVYEAIQDLIFDQFRLGGKIATDSIAVGELIGQVNTDTIQQLIGTNLQNIASSLAQTAIQEREERLIDYSKQVQLANKNLAEAEQILGETLATLNNMKIEDVFIYHESLKLYSSVEVNENGKRRTTKFHGREMQVFSALDNLFTLADLNIINLPDTDSIYGIVLNLADGAVAHQSLPLVENYLSIFAGLLLFSDIHDMATELAYQAIRGVENQTPTKVHLYLLNDTYVPGSMILTYVYQTLIEGYARINVKDGARVDIKTAAAEKTITTYLDARKNGAPYERDDWDFIADTIASNTTMQINFLSSYVSFIKKIAKTI